MSALIATLTWTPAENDITEMASYVIFRNVDGAPFAQLAVCKVNRDFLGAIASIDHCTTSTVPTNADKQAFTDAPVTYVDSTVAAGHTYGYYVVANPMGNNQSNNQGPSSTSNIFYATT